MKIVLVDDEENSRALLRTLLNKYCEHIEHIEEADNADEGIFLINKHQPQLVFLDIEMPDKNGFELLDAFQSGSFLTCFTTGYDSYAIKAIKYGAFDYLLKPIDIDELKAVVAKARKELESRKNDKVSPHVWVGDGNKIWKVELDKIYSIEASGNYSKIYTVENTILSSENLSKYEEILPENRFFRVHRSHIVNLAMITKVEDGRTGSITMKDSSVIPIANRRKKEFKTILEGKKLLG